MEHVSRFHASTSERSGVTTVTVMGCLTRESVSAATVISGWGISGEVSPDLFVDLRVADHVDPGGLAALEMYFAQLRGPQGLPEIRIALRLSFRVAARTREADMIGDHGSVETNGRTHLEQGP